MAFCELTESFTGAKHFLPGGATAARSQVRHGLIVPVRYSTRGSPGGDARRPGPPRRWSKRPAQPFFPSALLTFVTLVGLRYVVQMCCKVASPRATARWSLAPVLDYRPYAD
jgi:hypothetical protein